jgi:signal transduction histidine kinase
VSGWKRKSTIHPAVDAALAFLASAAFFLVAGAASPIRHHLVLILALGAAYIYVLFAAVQWGGPLYGVPLAISGGLALDSFYIPPIRDFGSDTWQNWLVIAIYISMAVFIGMLGQRSQRRAETSDEARGLLAEEQAALRRVATLVARGDKPDAIFASVAEEVARIVHVRSVGIARYEPDGSITELASFSEGGEVFPVGTRLPLEGTNVVAQVRESGRPARIDDQSGLEGEIAKALHALGVHSSVGIPIVVAGHLWGALVVASREPEPLPQRTEAQLADFTELLATAIANAESRAELDASRARIVATADATRRQIERDLHDGAQQQLVSLALELRAAQAGVPADLHEHRAELSHTVEGLKSVLEELRKIARGIHPAVLAEGGLRPALGALARRSAVPVELDVPADLSLPERVEVAAYYVVSEALTNAAKHAHASRVQVAVDMRDGVLRVSVRDDGDGGADPARGSGLLGLKDRLEAIGGTMSLESPPGGGTWLVGELQLHHPPTETGTVATGHLTADR